MGDSVKTVCAKANQKKNKTNNIMIVSYNILSVDESPAT